MDELQIPEFMLPTYHEPQRRPAPKKSPKHTKVYEIEKTILRLTVAFMLGMFVMYWAML